MRVKCVAQEHDAVSPARAQTRAARSRDERTNHEATASPTFYTIAHWKASIFHIFIYLMSCLDQDTENNFQTKAEEQVSSKMIFWVVVVSLCPALSKKVCVQSTTPAALCIFFILSFLWFGLTLSVGKFIHIFFSLNQLS